MIKQRTRAPHRQASRRSVVKPGDLIQTPGFSDPLSVVEVMDPAVGSAISAGLMKTFIVACRLHHNKPLTRNIVYRGTDWEFA